MLIYATGTSGTIGKHLIGVIPLKIDLTRSLEFYNLDLSKAQTVLHLAGIVGESNVVQNYNRAKAINLFGTLGLAEFVMKNSEARFIFISSSHVYEPSLKMHHEDSRLKPQSLYGKLKLDAEIGVKEVFSNAPERLLIARVFSVLGPNMPEGTLGWAIDHISEEKPLKFVDDERDFMNPKEIALTLCRLSNLDSEYQIINICTGLSKSVRVACKEYRKMRGLKTPEDWLIWGNSSVPRIVGDNSRLSEVLSCRQ